MENKIRVGSIVIHIKEDIEGDINYTEREGLKINEEYKVTKITGKNEYSVRFIYLEGIVERRE